MVVISDLELETVLTDSIALINLRGQIDFSNCHELREAIDEQLDTGTSKIVINARNLNFIDSSCLGMLVAALRKVKQHNGRLSLVVNQHIERVLTVSGLTALFEIHDGPEAALESLKEKA